MSKQVTYKQFCQRYELDPNAADSKNEYAKFCQNMNVFDDIIADKVTQQAIEKAKAK